MLSNFLNQLTYFNSEKTREEKGAKGVSVEKATPEGNLFNRSIC